MAIVKTLNVNNNNQNNKMSSNNNNSKDILTQEEMEWLKKKPRFLTCKEALDRIMWDLDLKDAYIHLSMVYKDRFEGDTLISYEEFLNSDLAEELPQHRIQQLIYRDCYIFWDKKNRIDMLSNGQLREYIVQFKKMEMEKNNEMDESFSTILQDSSSLSTTTLSTSTKQKKNKKDKKIMNEYIRQTTFSKVETQNSTSDEEDEYEQYMDEYDEINDEYCPPKILLNQ